MRVFSLTFVAALALAPGMVAAQPLPEGLTYDPGAMDACLADKSGWLERAACIGVPSAACMDTPAGSSTVGMVGCLDVERNQWDARLNAAYEGAMLRAEAADAADREAKTPGVPARAATLRDMQRRWLDYRDAACANAGAWWHGGTGQGPATVQCLMDQTGRQALLLDALGAEGGE